MVDVVSGNNVKVIAAVVIEQSKVSFLYFFMSIYRAP